MTLVVLRANLAIDAEVRMRAVQPFAAAVAARVANCSEHEVDEGGKNVGHGGSRGLGVAARPTCAGSARKARS
jgi:hypothetical protein